MLWMNSRHSRLPRTSQYSLWDPVSETAVIETVRHLRRKPDFRGERRAGTMGILQTRDMLLACHRLSDA